MAAPEPVYSSKGFAGARTGSTRTWGNSVFARESTVHREEDDEEALRWAALERLPTYDRVRTALLKNVGADGNVRHEEINVEKLRYEDRQQIVGSMFKVAEEDNEKFWRRFRDRIDRVGIDLPTIEVRFEHLNVEAGVYVGGRALPTLYNFTVNVIESLLNSLHILPSKKIPLTILNDVSGIIRPSRMTLLLGPPSAGKTTLLVALSGKLDPDLKVTGKITYNGHELTEFVPQRTSYYVSQHDVHIGEMTVRETLDFSGRCAGVGTRYDVLSELSRREKEANIKPDAELDVFLKASALEGRKSSIVTDYILKILGLDVCADTMVGDAMHRGISGGQKKRVTTGELIVGPARALFLDEISTGLDSSTTFQIISCLRQTVHLKDGTLLVSLLQPAPETYNLFDDIILLSEGHVVYQGPIEFVLDFFEGMGFKCPKRKGVADFLQEVTSRKDQEQYWADRSTPYSYVSVKQFVEGFAKFHVGRKLAEELSIPFDKSKSHPAALVTQKYAISNWELLRACFAREWLLMKRNSFIYVFKTFQISLMASIAMTVYFRTKISHDTINDGNKYMGALFFGLINVMFNGFAEVSLTVHRLPVFYKQRDLLFYPAWAYAIPAWIMRIPLSFLESFIWVFLSYWVIGFAPEAGRFFRQFLILFCVHQMALGLFRFIAAVGRNMIVSYTIGAFALLICFVLGGYVVDREDIHPWWIWGYWTSPLMYGQNALSVNEFLAHRWRKPFHGTSESLGKAILNSRGIFADGYWAWLGIGALIGYIFLFNALFTLTMTYMNPLGKPQAIIPEEVLAEKHANQTGQEVPLQAFSTKRTKSRSRSLSKTAASAEVGTELEQRESNNNDGDIVTAKKGMILPFEPLAIAFNHVNYFVDLPAEMKHQGVTDSRLQLLRDVSGAFRPGVLTALVGVSGAGKSTLMDVLAGRKTGGYIEGSISISGYPKNQETFARISGYCEQTDIHSPNVTVHESLIYSAWLRLPSEVDEATRMRFVEEVMELVELTPLKDGLVGLPGVTGLSTEQRKRLTIAVELVANPSIIFMDEPTSGLDARAAAIVMRAVRNTVDTGRTVVCTIHQPSIDIFEAFDELLLMKRGGRVIYAGPLGTKSYKLVEYFEAVDGVPKIKEDYNPATWMLEVSTVGAEAQLGVDFADLYANSELYQRNQALIAELSVPVPGSKDLYFATKFSQPFLQQSLACLWKQHCSYWRNPHYCVVRMFFTFVCSLIFGTIFWDRGSKRETAQEVLNVMGALFSSVLFIGINNASTVQPVVEIERTVCYRERAAGMYSAIAYAIAQVLIEVPYIFAQSIIYGLIVYSMVNFDWTVAKFFWFFFFMFMTFLYFTYYGMMAVALTPNEQFSAVISAAFYASWNLFSGFLIPRPEIPIWWRWNYWATPVAWTLYGLIASQLGNFETPLTTPDGLTTTVKDFLKSYFGFHHSFLGVVAAVHVGLVLGFASIFALCIKHFNFQKR